MGCLAREPVAGVELAHARGKPLNKYIINIGMHKEAVGAHAGLPGVAEFGCERAGGGAIEIGVGADDERGVAAQLQDTR